MSVKILFSAIFLCALASTQGQELNISNPDQFGLVEFKIHGYSGSSHYKKPLQIELTNNSTKKQTIKVDHGLLLAPVESKYQTFVVTRDESITLMPGEHKSVRIWAMCTESHDAAPNCETDFTVGEMAAPDLIQIVDFIAEHEYYNYEAQTAVWAMVGNYQLTDIVGFDTTLTQNLVKIVANAKGIEIPPPPASDDYARNYYAPTYTFKARMSGDFSYNLHEEREIIIAMFDKDNIVVRELFRDESCKPGKHELNFEFDAVQYHDELYFVRLLEDGEVILELEVKKPPYQQRG